LLKPFLPDAERVRIPFEMTEFGFTLSSEECAPDALVRVARHAEEAGFPFVVVSDHFHPWTDRQGQSPFVWSVIGAVSQATERIRIGTGVTCPTIRIHPALVAQAAATCASLLPGRFFLGVGTGEALNEHIAGARWPAADERRAMLEEAIEVIRTLWRGENTTLRTPHYTVENARLYSLPRALPPIYVAAGGPKAAELAARAGDGLVATAPVPDTIDAFERAGGEGPKYGQMTVCYAEDEATARKIATEWWPNAAMGGQLGQEVPTPSQFQDIAELVREDDIAQRIVCGPDPEAHIAKLREYADAGYTHVYVHQVGEEQDAAIDFYAREVLPKVA
jgi:G6PDH family F420-dependent oxidoreductase